MEERLRSGDRHEKRVGECLLSLYIIADRVSSNLSQVDYHSAFAVDSTS